MPHRIPFQVVELENKSYHIIVEGKIEESAIMLIIDTGASRTIFDSSYASKFGKIPIESENPIATGITAEQIPVEMINIPILSIGKFMFNNINALTADLTSINEVYSKLTGKKIDGLIGCDFLLSNVKSIDLRRKCLIILDIEK